MVQSRTYTKEQLEMCGKAQCGCVWHAEQGIPCKHDLALMGAQVDTEVPFEETTDKECEPLDEIGDDFDDGEDFRDKDRAKPQMSSSPAFHDDDSLY